MLVVTMHDVTLTVAAIITVIIDFPDQVLRVLFVECDPRINAGVDIDAMLVDVH